MYHHCRQVQGGVALLWYISVETVCWISTLQATRLQLTYGVMIAWTYAVWACRYFLCGNILTMAKTWHWPREKIRKFSQCKKFQSLSKFSNCSNISPLWNILHHHNEMTYLIGSWVHADNHLWFSNVHDFEQEIPPFFPITTGWLTKEAVLRLPHSDNHWGGLGGQRSVFSPLCG